MGFLKFIFGSTKTSYSSLYLVSKAQVENLVTKAGILTLTQDEKEDVHRALLKARIGGSKLSLKIIDEVLIKLRSSRKISDNDRKGVLKKFEKHFKKNSN